MENTITFKEIFGVLRKRLLFIICIVIGSTSIATLISYLYITPIYQAESQILVNQTIVGNESYVIAQQVETDLQLINTYNVIIKSPAILNKVIDKLQLNTTPEILTEKIFLSNENNSKVVTIRVRDENHKDAVLIANTLADIFKDEIPVLMKIDNIKILSNAMEKNNPVPIKPNHLLNILVGLAIGIALSIFLAFLLEFWDSTIKDEKDIEIILALPVMGIVNQMDDARKNKK